MKRTLFFVFAFWVAAVFGGPGFAFAEYDPYGNEMLGANKLILGVSAVDKTLENAQKQVDKKVNQLIRDLVSKGILRQDIKTTSYHISPELNYSNDNVLGEKSSLTVYKVEHKILVSSDFATLMNVADMALKQGASITSSQPFSLIPAQTSNSSKPSLIYSDYTPLWMDKNGVVYGASDSIVLKSNDLWKTCGKLGNSFNTSKYGKIQAVMVSDSGRIIVTTDDSGSTGVGHVFVSDAGKSSFGQDPAFSYVSGYTSRQFGHSVNGDIVILGSYGKFVPGNMPREVYLSRDGGSTWKRIFFGTPMGDAHIHDVCYDPYDSRIWVVFEDSGAPNRLFYSDDMGGSWTEIGDPKSGKSGISVTQIVAFPHGVVFGSDGAPDGLYYWPRPKDKRQAPVSREDIVKNFYLLGAEDQFIHIAHRSWSANYKDSKVALIPFTRESAKDKENAAQLRILATNDGLNWQEIWQHPGYSNGRGNCIRAVIGPHPGDPSRTFLAAVDIEYITYYLRGTLPKF